MKPTEASTQPDTPTPNTDDYSEKKRGQHKLYYGPYGWLTTKELEAEFAKDFAKYQESNPLKYKHAMAEQSFRNSFIARTPSA